MTTDPGPDGPRPAPEAGRTAGPASTVEPAARRGRLTIADEVVERIAAVAAAGPAEVLKRRSLIRGSNEHGVQAVAKVSPTATDVAVTVAMAYPVDTAAVVDALRRRVAHDVHRYTGLTVAAVRVRVADFDEPESRLQ